MAQRRTVSPEQVAPVGSVFLPPGGTEAAPDHVVVPPEVVRAMAEWWNQKPAFEARLRVATANQRVRNADAAARALNLAQQYFADNDPEAERPSRAEVRAAVNEALRP